MPANDTQLPARRRGRPPKRIEEDPEPRKSRKRPQRSASIDTVPQRKKREKNSAKETPTNPVISRSSSPDRCNCNNCVWGDFTGIRYKCAVCEDYDLCSSCYDHNYHDLHHPFMKISKPGAKPTYLSARCKAPCILPSFTTPKPSPSQPFTPPDQVEFPSSPFFYKTMSTAELKTFLKERGVEFGEVLDNKSLCRLAWDTHCDCVSFVELVAFLWDRGISTDDCRNINSTRQKAKDAFEALTSTIQFRKDDRVVLTGLNQAEMNGKTAVVIQISVSEGKALVKALDKTYRIKLKNLKMEDDGEVIEELE